MKFSKETIAVLKNYASINTNIFLDGSGKLASMTSAKNVFTKTSIAETFPKKIGIYDINEFIGVLSLFTEPEITFEDGYLIIEQGSNKIRFVGAPDSVIVSPTDKQFETLNSFMDATVFTFDLDAATLTSLIKTASVIKAPDLSFVANGSELKLVATDLKNVSSNKYEHTVSTCDKNFNVDLKLDTIKLIETDYKVEISSNKAVRFSAKNSDLIYYIAFEQTSRVA